MRLLNEQARTAKSMALFALKNNPAFRFYERHGFEVIRERPAPRWSCAVRWLRRLDPADY
jgi:ribosomal protein S18 acetylase RimI-like enzyme